MEQLSIFDDFIEEEKSEDYISANDLIPEKWERWKFRDIRLTQRNGDIYEIEAVVALMPNNRVYVKEWMKYPFMYEFSTFREASKKYLEYRNIIVERMKYNNWHKKTWQTDEPPVFSDMWRCGEKEFSCFEYADKVNNGYNIANRQS